jgi:hypothetical protein
LECTLATYTILCDRKKQPKAELDRHEAIIKHAFNDIGQDLKDVTPEMASRVARIAKDIAREGYEAGIQRYFNRHRYGTTE